MTTISKIYETLQTSVENDVLVLTPNSLQEFPMGDVFGLLQTENLKLQDVELEANPAKESVALFGRVALFGNDQTELTLTFRKAEDMTLAFGLSATLPVGFVPGAPWLSLEAMQVDLQIVGKGSEVTGKMTGTLRSGDLALDLQSQVSRADGTYTLAWTIAELDLSAIAALFLDGHPMPAEVPDIGFADVEISVIPASGAFSLSAASAKAWAFPANGGSLTISEAQLHVERTVEGEGLERSSQINAQISISGHEPIDIAPDFTISSFDLGFELSGADWQVQGEVASVLFDEPLSLAAEYSQKEDERTLSLNSEFPKLKDLINLNGVGSFGVTAVALTYQRSGSAAEETTSATDWSLAASGRMAIDEVLDFEGTLTFAKTADGISLVFVPEADAAKVEIDVPYSGQIDLSFGSLSFVRQGDSANRSWMFESTVAAEFKAWYPQVQDYLPETINATFQASNHGVAVTADRLLAPFDFDIPDVTVGSHTIEVGDARIDVTDLSVRLGKEVELSARIGVGLPRELNYLFGVDEQGNPSPELFKTLDQEDGMIEVELAIDMTDGIRLVPRSSFLAAVEIVEEGEFTFWHLNLGEFGAVKFQVPVFSYDTTGSSFRASGGFEVIESLSIPLTPAKLFLEAVGLEALAKGIPDGIPVEPIKIVEDGDLKTEELVALLEGVTGGDFPDDLGKIVNDIGDHLERLPESFLDYLNVDLPESFFFDVAVTPKGEIRLDTRVNDPNGEEDAENDHEQDSIRLLFPSFTPFPIPMPTLNGMELRSLSFGTLSGGSLFLLEVDATLDQFDIPTLASALLIPDIDELPLPDTTELHRRLILNKLFMIVIYQTGIPIPVPLFYDNLGINYLGLEGVDFETSLQFPQPSFDLAEVGQVLSQFKEFFTDRDFLLDPDQAPENFNLKFSFPLANNFLQLPEYLGSKRLGSSGDTGIEIDAYRNLAHLLNGLKTFSINRMIQAVPLEHRVNSVDVSFGPLNIDAGWLITTPGEFQQIATHPADRQQVYERLGFTDEAEAQEVFAIAPLPAAGNKANPTQEEGLVTLLRGTWALADVAQFDAAFGLAASGSQGFSTGFRIAGEIDNFLDMEVAGRVAINAPSQSDPPALEQAVSAVQEVRYGLSFDGQNDYVQLNNPDGLNFEDRITIEAWIRPEATNGIRNIVAHGHQVSPDGEVFLRINNGRYEVGSWDGPAYMTGVQIPSEDVGNWVHLAGLYNGQRWQLYRNGQLVSQTPANKGAMTFDANWAIGARGTGTERFFKGQIDEVRIWNRHRIGAEIQADRSTPLTGQEPGLVGYWSFDEGTGARARDLSAHQHHGTVHGAQWLAAGAPLVLINPEVEPSRKAFQLKGHSHLSVLNHRIFAGDVRIADDNFEIQGNFSLFPPASPFQVNGQIDGSISRTAISLNGDVSASLAGFELIGAKAILNNQRLYLQGSWMGVTTTLDVTARGQALVLQGDVDVSLWGLQAGLSVDIETDRGVTVQGEVKGFSLLNGAFRLSGANGQPNPSMFLEVEEHSPLRAELSGAVSLLGFTSQTTLSVNDDRFVFNARGNAFNRFQCNMKAEGKQLTSAADFRLSGSFETDLLQYLNEKTTKEIQSTVDDATKEINEAQAKVTEAQREVDRLQVLVDQKRDEVRRERRAAEMDVARWERTVADARDKVSSLNHEIRALQAKKDKLNKSWEQLERLALAGTIKILEASKDAARRLLKEVEDSLKLAQKGVSKVPIDSDPRVLSQLGLLKTAQGSLSLAQEALKVAESSVGAFGTVSNYITQHGLSNVLNVHSASFDLKLNAVSGNQMHLQFDLVYLGKRQTTSMRFNFNDPLSSAKALAKQLLHTV